MRFSSNGIRSLLRAAAPALFVLPALFSCSPADTAAPAAATPVLHFVASGICVTGLGGFDEVDEVEVGNSGPAASFWFAGGCLRVPCRWSPGETYHVRVAGRGGGASRSVALSARAPQQPGFAVLNIVGLRAHLGGGGGGLRQTWRYATSDDVGTALRDPSDPYGWAHEPGIYRILPLPDGEALALAVYSRGGGGDRIERSVLYRFSLAGRRAVWRWPRQAPLDAVATWFDADPAGRTAALCSYRGGDGEGSVRVIEGAGGRLLARHRVSPLRPLLRRVTFWRSLAVSPDGRRVALATNDGRAWLWSPGEDALPVPVTLGEPMVIGELPLLISGAGVAATASAALFVTGTTYLPWELTSERVPPEPHPQALVVLAYGWDGRLRGTLPVPSLAQGVSLGGRGRWLLLSYSSDPQFGPPGGSGLLAVSLGGPRIAAVASYPLAGGAMHGPPAASPDGHLIVLTERPRRARGGERSIGADRLHFLCW